MNPVFWQTISGLGGVVIGILGTFFVGMYTSRQDIKKAKLLYEQQLHDDERLYLQKLDEIYITNARLHVDTVYIPLNISLTKLADAYEGFLGAWEFYEELHKEEEESFWEICWVCVAEISELFAQGKDVFLTTNLESSLRSFIKFIRDELNEQKRYGGPFGWTSFGERLSADINKLKSLIREVTLGTNSTLIQNGAANATKSEAAQRNDMEKSTTEAVVLSGISDF